MVKRLISAYASEILQMNKNELFESIKASEGRVILAENVCTRFPVGFDISNAEVSRAFGADLILLNAFDVFNPHIEAINSENPIKKLKELIARPVGINLEPVDENVKMLENRLEIPEGRKATEKTFKKANQLGLDFICLTGNPGTGVTNKEISKAIKLASSIFNGLIIAGKMHKSGVDEEIIDLDAINEFIENGADIILLPACGTVVGVDIDEVKEACKLIRKKGKLSMSAIGTSQEGSQPEVIREIALLNKRAGVDIHHIGDAGYSGVAPYLNILELSRTIRGDRHTIRTIAASVNR
ncbi:MAG: haloacid dehalogenase-like hydrolase [Tissierellia bacterium]|nr:haloacid dehalogenase-like hydrolase [Tissierellia bacterium]